jgi:hypothetical protein
VAIKTLRFVSEITTSEVPATALSPAVASVASPLKHTAFNTALNLTPTSTPGVTVPAYFVKALSGGTGTIDLTAVTHNGAAVDFTGLKVKALKFKNKTGNAVMTIGEGASNGYEALGNAWTIKLLAGQEATFYLADSAPAVGGSAKTIDLVGTGTQELEVTVIGGP